MIGAQALTFSILTIPERGHYLKRLLESILALGVDPMPCVNVIYNRRVDGALHRVEEEIRALAPKLSLDVFFNAGDPTIVAGRNLQLSVCRTPLIAFVDDDITLHGDVIGGILNTLATHPVGLLGFRSLNGDTEAAVKPRETTPSIDWNGLRFMPVQGMLCAGYRSLLADLGGFNPRRRYWGEWTELNLRLWRSGYPTGHVMDGGYLRHWENAPDSPTRNMEGRAQHVLWGLICTALEYDAVDMNQATETFWRLVQERYLAYSFGDELSNQELLRAVLGLVPELSNAWAEITRFREDVRRHPFDFKPFQPIKEEDLAKVLPFARRHLRKYRWDTWPQKTFARSLGAAFSRFFHKENHKETKGTAPKVAPQER